ncbi:MAG: MATE family efflux transporter [Erysipelotrichaceae bacterium]|nr:MATE family efflux transporter [Erysipelotrichaceae bacterium]
MKEIDLTKGNIFNKLISFSLPMIAGNLLQQIYNFVDTLIVGKYLGANALAAVGSAYTLMIFITSIIIGLCMGSGAFFSEDYGAGEKKKLKEDIWLSFWFIFSVSILIYFIVYPGMDFILRILQTPKELMTLTKEYVTVVFAGIIFVYLYNFFAYLLRAIGNSFIPLVFLLISSLLNIALDIYFVTGLNMGVAGAALATVIAQAVSGLGILIYSMYKLPFLKNRKDRMIFNLQRLKQIIINDVATGIQQSVMNFGILMIQGLVNSFGTIVMASFAAAVKIDTLAYMPAQEFGNAYSLFVSQNYGANKKERIKEGTKISFAVSFIFCLMISFLVYIFAGSLMQIFIDASETAIIKEGIRYLRIEGAMYVGIGMLFLWYGYFRGINKPQISLLLTIISLGTRVLLSYALAPRTPLGVVAIWCSIPIGWILADLSGFYLYLKKNILDI